MTGMQNIQQCDHYHCTMYSIINFDGMQNCAYHLSKFHCNQCGKQCQVQNGKTNMYTSFLCLKCQFRGKTYTKDHDDFTVFCDYKGCNNVSVMDFDGDFCCKAHLARQSLAPLQGASSKQLS
jgi:hypothetical protein